MREAPREPTRCTPGVQIARLILPLALLLSALLDGLAPARCIPGRRTLQRYLVGLAHLDRLPLGGLAFVIATSIPAFLFLKLLTSGSGSQALTKTQDSE